MSCLKSRSEFLRCSFSLKDLIEVDHRMEAANRAQIRIDCAIILNLSRIGNAEHSVEAAVIAYISANTK